VKSTAFTELATRSPEGFPSDSCGSAYGYIVLNNPHELADQVKQASLLDALGVPRRTGGCR
jgi:hypothetical protein